jgi:hypothetical protein
MGALVAAPNGDLLFVEQTPMRTKLLANGK